jgi:cysteine-rich repeat protein
LNTCTAAACGDGIVHQAVEECDDGNLENGDGCDRTCTLEICGNGRVEGGEACDDGNSIDTDACYDCALAFCGDGKIFEGVEVCDDGNQLPGDECSVDCRLDDHGDEPDTATTIDLIGTVTAGLRMIVETATLGDQDDRDVFRITANVTGMHRIRTRALNGLDTFCRVYTAEGVLSGLQDNRAKPDGYFDCEVSIYLERGDFGFVEISASVWGGGTAFSLWLQEPCGNGSIDPNEECDPNSPHSNRFRCRADCRLRRSLAISGRSVCSAANGGVSCWGANDTLLLGSDEDIPSAYLDSCLNDADPYRAPVNSSYRPVQVVPEGSAYEDLSAGAKGSVCALDTRTNLAMCWGRVGDMNANNFLDLEGYNFDLCHGESIPYNWNPELQTRGSCSPSPTLYGTGNPHENRWRYPAQGLSAGSSASCLLGMDQQVRCWGTVADGVLGVGDGPLEANVLGYVTPMPSVIERRHHVEYLAMGDQTACAVTREGRVLCWGANNLGQAGTNRQTGQQRGCRGACETIPHLVDGDLGVVVHLSLAQDHACALNAEGRVYCWGNNEDLQTGVASEALCGDTPCHLRPVRLEHLSGIRDVATARRHTCVITHDGSVYCWGNNSVGQLGIGALNLGLGEQVDRTLEPYRVGSLPAVSAISANGDTTCARTDSGRILCWGANHYGQVGIPCTTPVVSTPTELRTTP